MHFTIWDLVCLGACLISMIAGYVRGFTWDSGKWLAMLLGIFTSHYFMRFTDLYHWQALVFRSASLISIWGTSLITLSKLSRMISNSPLAPIDRVLGAIGGLARGFAILLLTFGVARVVLKEQPPELTQALSYSFFASNWAALIAHLPPKYKKMINQTHIISHNRSSYA